jgi:uncharacterized protein with HEPN domain
MSRRDPRVCLADMLDYAANAKRFCDGKLWSDFQSDELLQLALIRALEVVGEAAQRISPADRQAWPTIPWNQIVGMRNRLVHGYEQVNLHLIWDTVQGDLPPLIVACRAVIGGA